MSGVAYFITDRQRFGEAESWEAVEQAVELGVDWIQIRDKEATSRYLEAWVEGALELAGRGLSRPRVLVNDRLDVALACGADGVHLPAEGLPIASVRKVSPPGFLIGVSTHSNREVVGAARQGADFAVFGPVFETSSKPGRPALGLEKFAEAARSVEMPVLALGGMTGSRVHDVMRVGASGVAGISVFYEKRRARRLLDALRAPGG